MKKLLTLSLILNILCLGLIAWLVVTSEARMRHAAVAVIIEDTDNFYQSVEQATIENNKDKFGKIYAEMGVEYESEPTTISEMIQPLAEIMSKADIQRDTLESPSDNTAEQGEGDSERTR